MARSRMKRAVLSWSNILQSSDYYLPNPGKVQFPAPFTFIRVIKSSGVNINLLFWWNVNWICPVPCPATQLPVGNHRETLFARRDNLTGSSEALSTESDVKSNLQRRILRWGMGECLKRPLSNSPASFKSQMGLEIFLVTDAPAPFSYSLQKRVRSGLNPRCLHGLPTPSGSEIFATRNSSNLSQSHIYNSESSTFALQEYTCILFYHSYLLSVWNNISPDSTLLFMQVMKPAMIMNVHISFEVLLNWVLTWSRFNPLVQ